MIENLFYGVQLLHVWHFTHSQACWVFDVCVCVCMCVCVCVLFIYTISISIICVFHKKGGGIGNIGEIGGLAPLCQLCKETLKISHPSPPFENHHF